MKKELYIKKAKQRRSDRKFGRNILMVIAKDKNEELVKLLPDAKWEDIANYFKVSKQWAYKRYKETKEELLLR